MNKLCSILAYLNPIICHPFFLLPSVLGAINRLRFANTDNSRLAMASSDGTISVCSTWPPGKERTVIHVLFGGHAPATPITDVVWSFSNDFLVSTALDGTVCLWDTKSGDLRRIYSAVSVDVGPALVCAFQPLNYNLLVVGGAWGRIQVGTVEIFRMFCPLIMRVG